MHRLKQSIRWHEANTGQRHVPLRRLVNRSILFGKGPTVALRSAVQRVLRGGGAKNTIVFLMGGPGSGKGTHSEKLAEKYGFVHLSTGELLRAEVKRGTALGNQIKDIMNLDSYGDGGVDLAEFLVAMSKKDQASFKMFDTNNDGVLDKDELTAAFQSLDVDGDGILSPAELRHVLTNMGDNLDDEAVDKLIREVSNAGHLVSDEVVLTLLKKAIENSDSTLFLLDGYPRVLEQARAFESKIGAPDVVVSIDISDETMTERLLKRGETSGRSDDNEATIKNRIKIFHDQTAPTIRYYEEKGILRRVDGEETVDEVFERIDAELDAPPEGMDRLVKIL